ncbi:P-loop containing nucleoside triphosphate hydrolase protein [Agrocybe pediades]|nr:P-loop containing nucleoside triphosphate hydrolase protein [Agrocybe pediades]
MKIPSVAVNGDTWNPALKEELEQGRYQAIFASPEMCLKNADFRRILSGSEFNDITAIIVDEAHCISQWGGDFRPSYSEMGKLRAFFPPHIPILATSATLTKEALKEVRSSLSIDADRSFFLNLGNDRINIAFSAHEIKSSTDYEALKPHLLRIAQPTSRTDIDKSIVFVNSKLTTQIVAHVVRSWLPPHLRDCVDFLHALRSERGKRRAMRRFRKGETRILIATEAAGMGADIPDINNVVQFGVPASMAIWIQRAGRAGRSPEIRAHAVLLAEKAMNDKQKKRGTATSSNKPTETQVVLDAESDLEALMDDDTEGIIVDQDGGEDGHYTYKKKVDEGLREWINSKGCRRAIANIYFNNPVSTAYIDGASGHMTEQL